MSDNQNINVKNPISFSRQGVSQISTTESDSQMIDDVLKELEGQETEQKEVNSQNIIDSLVEEVGTIGSEGRLPDDLPTSRQDSGEVKPVSAEDYGVVKKETENFGGKNSQFLEPLKNAKFEYERLGQSDNEQKIIGVQAIEIYLHWVEESKKLLREDLSDGEKEKISIFIPKRIQEQLKSGATPSPFVLKKSNETTLLSPKVEKERTISIDRKENNLHERVHRIEERINKLDQNKPEYPEELLSLKTKKVLVEEEIRNNVDEESADTDQERLAQELSTQEVLNKSSFKNKAPVVRPKKEEWERLEKAQLAEEIEKDEDEKKQEDKPEQKETATKPAFTTPEPLTKADVAKSFSETKSETPRKNEGSAPVYTDEQLRTVDKIRKEFWKKLSSAKSEWYKSPSKNRDFVNKQIIQVSGILSDKEATEIDMNDIQTARIFMFNNAPDKILKHPAFSYVESFYNYQSSQGCIGINPEEVFLKQKNTGPDLKPLSEGSSESKRGRSFVEQVSIKKPVGLNTDSEKSSEERKKMTF